MQIIYFVKIYLDIYLRIHTHRYTDIQWCNAKQNNETWNYNYKRRIEADYCENTTHIHKDFVMKCFACLCVCVDVCLYAIHACA